MATARDVQERLRALGYYNGKIDGQIGPVTLSAALSALGGAPARSTPDTDGAVMSTSAAGRKAISQREGVRLKAYKDSRGILTIGVGHTSAAGAPAVTSGMTITAAEADAILSRDLADVEAAVHRAVTVALTQNEFDALASLTINIGPGAFAGSSVVKRLNAGDRAGAANAFLMWKKAGNDPDILLSRRQDERVQFLTS